MDRLTKWLGRDDAPDAPGAVQQHASEVAPLPALSEPLAEVAASADVPRMPDHVVQQATVPPAPATPAPADRVPYFERERVLTPAVYTAEVSAQDAAAAPVVSPQPPAPARSRFAHLVPDTAPIVATPAAVPAPVPVAVVATPAPVPVAVVETAAVPAPPVVETEAAPATTTPATAADLTVAPPVMDVPAAVETAPEPGKIRTLADMAQGQELLPPYTKAERPAIPDRMPFAKTIQAVETPAPAAPPAAAAAPVPVPAMAAPAPAPAAAPVPAPAPPAPAPQSSDSFVYIPGQPSGQPISSIPAPPPPASAGPAPVAPAPSRPKLSDKMRTPPAPAAPPAPVARAQKKSRRRFF